jgi:subtilase family serine protease
MLAVDYAPAQVRLDQKIDPNDEPTGSVCSSGPVRCFAHVRTHETGEVRPFAAPNGYGPPDLVAAYSIPTNITTKPVIAIVDAYGYTALESDLAMYRSQYGLPACTKANGCLNVINQSGQATPLPVDPPTTDDWTVETALDVDMASAACPNCKILVVQATDNAGDGLYTAQMAAAAAGATVISNSWGGPEGGPVTATETYFNHAGIGVYVAAGDDGYNDAGQGPDYPGTSAYVIAVGGTHLVRDTSARGFTETAWSKGGSACSLSVPKPAYQSASPCQFKATTDVAAVGDPATGVAVYNARNGGWIAVGGTSASAPFVASMMAATGHGNETSGSFFAQNVAKLNDVSAGTNGTCTTPGAILCTAGAGWDGPTGYGTPNATKFTTMGNGNGDGGGSNNGGGTNPPGGGDGSNDIEGSCSAGGGGGAGAGLVVGLAVVIRIRRRRR